MAARPDRRSSMGVDRRASGSLAMSPATDDDDDYDLQAAGVADGFRPAQVSANHVRIPSTTTSHDHDPHPPQGRRTPPPRPSSTTKPPRNSFTLRHDGATNPGAPRNPTVAMSGALPSRSSTSTDATFVRSESPYRGPAGPSHPYQMYAQGAPVTRSPSAATSSTIRPPERTYEGPSGPTHPYGMYPQNTAPESDSSSTQTVPVLVGFPGLNNDYQRRLGPDGEEVADIIGPDGHTEQLPPYTQYPDEAFARKARSAIPPGPVPALPAGAGGIGLATRDPEFSSQEDLNAPPSRRSTRSAMSDSTTSSNQSSTAPEPLTQPESEKPEQKRWKRIARKKLCGIVPVWSIMLVVITLVLFVIILLAVLASMWHKHNMRRPHHISDNGSGGPHSSSMDPSMATTIDASPFISLPTNIPRLPTGTFQLPITTPSVAPATCLDTKHRSAWSCDISPLVMPYQLKVSPIGGSNILSNNEIILNMGNNSLNSMPYGAQPPTLAHPQVLNLALDKYSIDRGPAWYFETLVYNKVVVVPEGGLPAPGGSPGAKRDAYWPPRDYVPGLARKDTPQPGEKPWFCYWNHTVLEAFIYVNDTSTAACAHPTSTPAPGASTTSAGSPAQATQGAGTGFSDPVFLPCYPKVIKIEERRISTQDGNPAPYCVQQYITGDGTPKPYLNSTGQPVKIFLTETEPPIPPPLDRRGPGFDGLDGSDAGVDERDSTAPSCGCVWMSQ